jgi:hypothetical protein
MKKIIVFTAMTVLVGFGSCKETTQQDNTTQNADTMVIKEDRTDTATTTISTDTTQR